MKSRSPNLTIAPSQSARNLRVVFDKQYPWMTKLQICASLLTIAYAILVPFDMSSERLQHLQNNAAQISGLIVKLAIISPGVKGYRPF